jgi:hypothetical protein
MAKNKLSFDAIFEGNDIKDDAKKRISAMLEDVVATRMEAKDDEDKEDDDDEDEMKDGEKKMEAKAMDSEAEDKDADDEKDPEVEDEEKDHEAKETPSQEKKEHTDGDEPKEEDEMYEEDEDTSDPASLALADFPDLAKDNEFKQAFRALMGPTFSKLKPAFVATFNDLNHNQMAKPFVDAFTTILKFLAKDATAVARLKSFVKSTSSEEPMAAAPEEAYSEAFTNKLDKYLTYVAEEWAENNKIALENGIKVQIAESFLSNMKGMYEQYNFTNIPTRDMVVELGTKVTEAEQKLNEQIEKNAQLRIKYNKQRKEMLVLESSKGLTATQVEKFKKLTEDVAFEDEKSFKNKVAVIKENAFTKTVVKSDTKLETETGPQEELLHENTRMGKYVDTISRSLKF